jgi:quinol monooxygenase YgiN
MAYMVTGRYRVKAGQDAKFVAQMELLEDLLRREGRGLQYWALARSDGEAGVFTSVAIWASPEDERRLHDHPMRLALVPTIARLLREPPGAVAGPVMLELAGRK